MIFLNPKYITHNTLQETRRVWSAISGHASKHIILKGIVYLEGDLFPVSEGIRERAAAVNFNNGRLSFDMRDEVWIF